MRGAQFVLIGIPTILRNTLLSKMNKNVFISPLQYLSLIITIRYNNSNHTLHGLTECHFYQIWIMIKVMVFTATLNNISLKVLCSRKTKEDSQNGQWLIKTYSQEYHVVIDDGVFVNGFSLDNLSVEYISRSVCLCLVC